MRDGEGADRHALRYDWDRRPDARLVDLAAPGGALERLTEFARQSPHPVTVDFWADHDAHLQRYILCIGFRRAAEITWQPHRLRVDLARVIRERRITVPASTWLPAANAPRVADALTGMLGRAAPLLSHGSGAAASGVLAVGDYALVASRFMGTFPAAERRLVIGELAADLLDAVASARIPGYIPAMKPAADALLLDDDGGLVVAEVESARAAEVAYAPAQAILCLRLLRLWADTATVTAPERVMSSRASTVLADVLDARRMSGATFGAPARLDTKARSSALVAVEAGLSPRLQDRLLSVWHALARAGVPEASELRVAEFERDGVKREVRF